MIYRSITAALQGIDATLVTCEVALTTGIRTIMIGLPDTAVKESRDRMESALRESGYKFPRRAVTINLAPADVRKEGSLYDVPMAVALMAADEKIPAEKLEQYMLVGELSLDGTIRSVKGCLPFAILARKMGLKGIVVPRENACEAAVVNNLEVRVVDHLRDVLAFFNGESELEIKEINTREIFQQAERSFPCDFRDVKGQNQVKRAFAIARAKNTVTYPSSLMLVASMKRCAQSIQTTSLETYNTTFNPCPCGYYHHPTKHCFCTPAQRDRYLNRVSGPMLDRIDQNGEFPNKTIPHRFSQERRKKCVRNPDHIFLDRIDIQIEIAPLSFDQLSRMEPGESSHDIRERVIRARQIQERRFAGEEGIHCNAQMTSRLMREHCQLSAQDMEILRSAMNRLQLSARAYDRILRVSRTIADLAGSPSITAEHLGEAISYRNMDRSTWGE